MKTRILKFHLPPVGETWRVLHDGTRVLAVGWQGQQLVVWVESPGTGELMPVVFTVAMTGDQRPIGSYVGTAQLDADGELYVVHVYQRAAVQ